MFKLQVVYCPEDNLLEKVADGHCEKYVTKVVKSANDGMVTILMTSQEMIIDYVRICVVRKLINHKDVEFMYKDKLIFIDKFGHLDWWPEGFCDYKDKILEELLNTMME